MRDSAKASKEFGPALAFRAWRAILPVSQVLISGPYMRYLIAYLATAVVFFAIDIVWLSQIAQSFYADALGPLMADPIRLDVAVAFYALYVVGVVIFAVAPGLEAGSARVALIRGALFGFFAYATYDLTNLATVQDWPWQVAAVDMPWGTFVTAVSAMGGCWVTLRVSAKR